MLDKTPHLNSKTGTRSTSIMVEWCLIESKIEINKKNHTSVVPFEKRNYNISIDEQIKNEICTIREKQTNQKRYMDSGKRLRISYLVSIFIVKAGPA